MPCGGVSSGMWVQALWCDRYAGATAAGRTRVGHATCAFAFTQGLICGRPRLGHQTADALTSQKWAFHWASASWSLNSQQVERTRAGEAGLGARLSTSPLAWGGWGRQAEGPGSALGVGAAHSLASSPLPGKGGDLLSKQG